ncbi:Dipeptidyl peptidase 3 [Araneus ventricosus]|uniref:Dipeptidyl peptidase 3 n=1 Tax=Araneus ventricosus TaxID=182803 RepID=A0A4Y2Q2F0_ARAVE|nr:Dipeptidyl peptidase 3 [Araneus ventricosus]
MVGKKKNGFISLFQTDVGHSILEFHCIIHQQALCAKSGLTSFDNVMAVVTKIVNLISSQALNKRKFDALLDEVNSVYNGLLMYNNVRWLSRGNVLQRFVDCLEEIRLFLQNEEKIEQYPQLLDVMWLSKLMFFTDICQRFNELKRMSDYIYPNNTPIALLNCEDAFKELTDKEKHYAHYLSKASWYGGLIVLLQTSLESPLIYTLLHKLFRLQSVSELKEIALKECEFTEDDFTAFLIYASGIFSNMGNYKGSGDSKFIPNLPEEKFRKLLLASKFAKEDPGHLDRLLSNSIESIYSLKDNLCRLGFPSNGITTYLSKNISKEDDDLVKNFMKEKAIEHGILGYLSVR